MFKAILKYGLIAGLVVGVFMIGAVLAMDGKLPHSSASMAVTYAVMLVALSAVFVGTKGYRDRERGGVIGFLPAFGMGLGITLVATLIYALAWEASLAMTGMDFMAEYSASVLAQMKAEGKSAAEIAEMTRDMAVWTEHYKNPLLRMALTATEIFPVGFLVSLVSALLLRRPTFMPARASA